MDIFLASKIRRFEQSSCGKINGLSSHKVGVAVCCRSPVNPALPAKYLLASYLLG